MLVCNNHLSNCRAFSQVVWISLHSLLFKTICACCVTLHCKGEQCRCLDFPNCSVYFDSPHKTSRLLFLGEKCRWWWVARVAPKLSSPRPPAERVQRGGRKCCWGCGCLAAACLLFPSVGLGSWWEAGLLGAMLGEPARACQSRDLQFSLNYSVTVSKGWIAESNKERSGEVGKD